MLLILLVFTILSGTDLGAYPQFVFENVTTQNGLSSHYVRCIAQDKYGLMWFGTDEGLNRYDGSQFDIFRHTRSADSGLNSSWINCIYEDSEGNLWIGTEKGISIFDIEDGTLKVLSDELDTGNRFGTQRVFAFHEDREKAMWIGTSQGIIRYDRSGHKLEHFVLINNPNNTLGNEITSIVEDVRGNLWIGSFDGVWRYSADTKLFEPFCANVNSSQNNYIESVYLHPDDPDHVYLATSTGFTIIDLDGRIISSYNMSNSKICDNDVCCIIKYDEDNLLLGTSNGLSLFNMSSRTFSTVEALSEYDVHLPSNYVRMFFEDQSGTIWVVTTMGLSKLDRNRKPVEISYIKSNSNEELINDISRVEGYGFWLATQKGIMMCDDKLKQTGRLGKLDGLTHDIIKRIHQDASGRIWVGTNNGLLYYDNAKKRFVNVRGNDVTFKYIYDIKEDSEGRIVANIPNGICVITVPETPGQGLLLEPVDLSQYLSQGNTGIPYLCVGHDNTLWLGTMNDGLIRWEGADGSIRQFNEESGLASNRIYSLFADKENNIWIGTDLGLSIISSDTGEVRNFEDDFYFSRSIRTITQDESGAMWIATANHLIKYSLETEERIVCSLQEQLGIRELTHNSVCSHDGYIYMSGNGFVLRFRPEEIAVNSVAPSAVISGFKLISTADEDYPDTREVYVTSKNEVRLKYNENSFRIIFTIPYYISSYSNTYQYMLENHDKTWSSTSGRNNWATYSNLKPGSYRFLVKGANSDGVSSEKVISFEIIITPPWYASSVAFILYFMIGTILLLGIYIMVQSRLSIRAELKEEQERNARIEKLNEMKMQFFTNISHEFRTPLSLIQGPVESLMGSIDDPVSLSQLNLIKQNGDRLQDLINQIMDLRKIESGRLTLNLTEMDVVLYTRQLVESFRAKAENRNISYEFDSETESLMMSLDQRKYEKILFNLISNAIKFTPDGGMITVNLRQIKDNSDGRKYIEVSVSDTGCGIRPENLPLVFERFYQESGGHVPYESMKGSGIGLVIAKDYVELHEGSISVSSVLGEGSTFRFCIPVDLKADVVEVEEKASVEEEPKVVTTSHTNASRPKIAVVEDDQDMLHFLRMILDTHYDVYTATDGRQGLEMIMEVFPDIILTDLMMNGMNGLELCKKVRDNALTSHIPIVILTANTSDDIHQQAYETGADSYLTKPFSVRTLQTRLNAILDNRLKLQDRYKKEFLTSPSELVIDSQEDKFIRQLVKIVEDNMSDPDFGIQQLCAEIRYPYQQVYRKIKMLTGESLNEFIRNIRLKRAAQYLSSTDLRVSEVMYKVGFNSHSYFTKCYKEYFGVPPTEHYSARNHNETEKQ